MAKKTILLILSITLHSLLFSQVREPADYTQAEKLYNENKYDAALSLFIKSIPQLATANKKASTKPVPKVATTETTHIQREVLVTGLNSIP